MKDLPEKTLPIQHLRFKKGDLLFKQGDYGISVYYVTQGKVGLFNESGEKEAGTGVLGPGEMIGDIMALHGTIRPRANSARVLEDAELEAWHPATLAAAYDSAPPMLKYIINQLMARLQRMESLMGKLSGFSQKKELAFPERAQGTSQRQFYRKGIDLPCHYRPLKTGQKVALEGRMKDLSFKGAGMEVSARNLIQYPQEKGDDFYIRLVLPNDKVVKFTARVIHIKEGKTPNRVFFGLEILAIDDASRRTLGFFLMP